MPIDLLIIKLIRIFLPKSALIYTAHNIFPQTDLLTIIFTNIFTIVSIK